MKTILLVLLIMTCMSTYSQSDSIEKAILHHNVLSGQIAQEEYIKTAKKWAETLRKFGQYPDLPVDQDGRVYYSFTDSIDGTNKDVLYSRCLEWIAIKHGIFPAALYSSREDGKIVFKSNFSTSGNVTGNYTSVITIRNHTFLIEFINIAYETFYPGYYSGDAWVPERYINSSIEQFYPVILSHSSEWNQKLNVLKSTNNNFKTEIANLHNYIVDYGMHYVF